MLKGSKIVLGVSGSIAAYKAVHLARLCVEGGAKVWPVLTASACRFVGPLTFSVLTGHRAVTDLWSAAQAGEVGHVELAQGADLLVLAPATADLLVRLAQGRADDPLAAVALATRAPWVLAPAMETGMWENPATQQAVAALERRGEDTGASVHLVPPGAGALASGRVGAGRMAEPPEVFEQMQAALTAQDFAGQTILVTAGPTREALDPARFISNPATGRMGYALARAARMRGARVRLVHGPTEVQTPPGVEATAVGSTDQMLQACRALLPGANALIMAAAPADFGPATPAASSKYKKEGRETLQLNLVATPDILKTLGARAAGCFVVGFAAETDDLVANARKKLTAKDLDLVVANPIGRPETGFGADTNQVTLVDRSGGITELPLLSKDAVAHSILDNLAAAL